MFGLFKKKEKAADPQMEEMRAFAAKFHPEELDVLVLTGAGGFTSGRVEGETLCSGVALLTAWVDESDGQVHEGTFRLLTKGDDTLMGYLSQRLPRDFILKCKARLSLDGKALMLLDLPTPGFDPDLKALLEQQKTPVVEEVEGLGQFTLNRTAGVLQGEVLWGEQPVQLCFDRDEEREKCVSAARSLLDNWSRWEELARTAAADALLDTANEWAAEADEEELTREGFMDCLGLETIDVSESGTFQLWYNDGELFAGQMIHLSGALTEGITDVKLGE